MRISAIILAGGLATRMNGVDKGLLLFHKKPLVQHVINRLTPQVDEIIINSNREIARYQAFGYTVFQDEFEDYAGPLAGFSLGLQYAMHDFVLTVPCDSPLLPFDLAARLMTALLEHKADIAVASSVDNVHPVFCLCTKNVLPSLTKYLEQGGRRVSTWQKSQKYIEVDFSDYNEAFTNLNTVEDLVELELKLA